MLVERGEPQQQQPNIEEVASQALEMCETDFNIVEKALLSMPSDLKHVSNSTINDILAYSSKQLDDLTDEQFILLAQVYPFRRIGNAIITDRKEVVRQLKNEVYYNAILRGATIEKTCQKIFYYYCKQKEREANKR